MKSYINWALISFFSILLISSCSDEEFIDTHTTVTTSEPVEEMGNAVAGLIQDFDDNPVDNVSVTLSSESIVLGRTMSDANGKYLIVLPDEEVKTSIITFEKDGFHRVRKLVETGTPKTVNSKMAIVSCVVEGLPDPIVISTTDLISLKGRAFHADGEPAVNSRVWISQQGDGPESILFLDIVTVDNEGNWEMIVPKGVELRFKLDLGSECNIATSRKIGPYSEDTMMEDLTGLDKTLTLNVKGTAVACDGSPLTDGLIRYYVNDFFNINSNFNLFNEDAEIFEDCYVTCDLDYTHGVLAYDGATNNYSIVQRPFEEVIDFGDVPTCTPLEAFIDLQFDGADANLIDASHIYKVYKGIYTKEEELGFAIENIQLIGTQGLMLNAFSTEVLEANNNYHNIATLTITDQSTDQNYANFDGDFIINEIVDGYAIGTMNGNIFKTMEAWPSGTYTSVGNAIKVSGDFKLLVY